MTAKSKAKDLGVRLEEESSATDPNGGKIIFEGTLRDGSDEMATDLFLAIQVFSVKDNGWINLSGPIQVSAGEIYHEYVLQDQSGNPADLLVTESANVGCVPTFRLVNTQPADRDWVEVLGFGGAIYRSGSNELHVDFGSRWLLEPHTIKHHLDTDFQDHEYAWTATVRPRGNQSIFPGWSLAVGNPELFKDYDPDLHDVLVVPKGDGNPRNGGDPVDTVSTLQNQISIQQSQLDSMVIHLDAKDRIINSQESYSLQLVQELDQVKQQLSGLETQVAAAQSQAEPASSVLAGIADEITTVQNQLSTGPLALTNVALDLKAFVLNSADGLKLQLVDGLQATTANSYTVSNLNLNFQPQVAPSDAPLVPLAPRVLGLTETVVRKKLMDFGLKLKPVYQLAPDVPKGQSFRQVPDPGTEVNPGQVITVLFAKPNTY